MVPVRLNLGQADCSAWTEVLAAGGFTLAEEGAATRIEVAALVSAEALPELRTFVLDGGRLLLFGDHGRVPSAFGFRWSGESAGGAAEPQQPGLPPLDLDDAHGVTGAGYALYRCGGRCVAVAGPRGAGWAVHLGALDPNLALACLRWVEMRSQYSGQTP